MADRTSGAVVALQGDLSSFALADVLQLLASSSKSGRLVVTGESDHGELWLRDGELAGGAASSRPTASNPADVIYEIHQLGDGSFVFDESEQLVDGPCQPVDEALEVAAGLQAKWDEVTAVVPTMEHRASMAPELAEGTDNVVVTAERWRLLAALGSGVSVRAVADRLDASDLEASQTVKSLVEDGLVRITEPEGLPDDTWQGYRTEDHAPEIAEHTESEPVDDDLEEAFDLDGLDIVVPEPAEEVASAEAELVRLGADDGPLVLETSDDAHLPEPLPGAGTSFSSEGDEFSGETDTLAPEVFSALDTGAPEDLHGAVDHAVPGPVSNAFAPVSTPAPHRVDALDALDHPTPGSDAPEPVAAVAEPVTDPYADVDTSGIWTDDSDGSSLGTDEAAFERVGWSQKNPPVDHLDDGSDRTSLLKFLSNVKH